MKKNKKKTSYLSKKDVNQLESMESVLIDSDETLSQSISRFYELIDEDALVPSQIALQACCEDNPKLHADIFTAWYSGLIEDEELFRLDKITSNTINEVRHLFDAKTKEWIEDGLLDSEYDTSFAFWGIIGLALHTSGKKLVERNQALDEDAFFKNPLFGKYKIRALEYADNCTLNDFQNPRSYNRYDKEALFIYAMGGFDGYEDYQRTLDIYNEVKSVVYRDPDRLLGEIKKELEQLAQSSKEKKIQYAFLYACAVIDYWLNNKKR